MGDLIFLKNDAVCFCITQGTVLSFYAICARFI